MYFLSVKPGGKIRILASSPKTKKHENTVCAVKLVYLIPGEFLNFLVRNFFLCYRKVSDDS